MKIDSYRTLTALSFVLIAISSAAAEPLDRTVLPIHEPQIKPITTLDARDAKAPPRFEVKAPEGAPNVVIVLIDDIGFGHSSAFGGPIKMPTLEKLANAGLRYNRFHTTALCSPTRTALLTGHNHHRTTRARSWSWRRRFPATPACVRGDHHARGNSAAEWLQHGGLWQISRDAAVGGVGLRAV